MKGQPDDFVLLVTHEFTAASSDYIRDTHAESWQEELNLSLDAETGVVALPEVTINFAIDPPIPELMELAGHTPEPFGASDLVLLGRHTTVWRLLGSGQFAAWPLMRLASTFIEAGASAVFIPRTRRLHSPRAIRRFAIDATPDAMANFFVAAFDGDGWMRTRGLTPFRMPELETEIDAGHNAAYFRLMDVAAAMIANGRAFDDGTSLTIGPHAHKITTGPRSTLTDELTINGIYGVQALL